LGNSGLDRNKVLRFGKWIPAYPPHLAAGTLELLCFVVSFFSDCKEFF
jgi:hypothetical protein